MARCRHHYTHTPLLFIIEKFLIILLLYVKRFISKEASFIYIQISAVSRHPAARRVHCSEPTRAIQLMLVLLFELSAGLVPSTSRQQQLYTLRDVARVKLDLAKAQEVVVVGGGAIGAYRRAGASLLEPALEVRTMLSGGELENPKDGVLEPARESGVTCGVRSVAFSWRCLESSSTGCK